MNYRNKLRTPSTEPPTTEKLYEGAVRALARRARSSGEMRQLLSKNKATSAQIEEILHRLRENGYLDDARFARYYAASRLENDLHGKARVRRDLAAKRLKPEIADAALGKTFENVDEHELLRQYLRRKVRISKPLSNPATVASLYRRLLRAGFSSATIVQELKKLHVPMGAGRMPGREPGREQRRVDDADVPSWDELLDSISEASDTEADIDQ